MFFTTINITKEEMINIFQRLLYILGTISPYAIITSICYGGRISYSVYAKWIEKSNEINIDVDMKRTCHTYQTLIHHDFKKGEM